MTSSEDSITLQPPSPASQVAPAKSILAGIDIHSVSEAARVESRSREVFLPPISVFRWWARRTGAMNSAVLAAAKTALGRDSLRVFDGFTGGGTIPLVTLLAGDYVAARDIHPWASRGVETMLGLPPAEELQDAFDSLEQIIDGPLESMYQLSDEPNGERLVHTFRVAHGLCPGCRRSQRLFPYSLLTLMTRKERGDPTAFLACPDGHVFEGRSDQECSCSVCGARTDPSEIYLPGRKATCSGCGLEVPLSDWASTEKFRWEPVLLEVSSGEGRTFRQPLDRELGALEMSSRVPTKLPEGRIPVGSETSVLLRHGFVEWSDLYPKRQLAAMELVLEAVEGLDLTDSLSRVVETCVFGLAEFPGYLTRWDRFYLKCNDATAGHRFNFSTFCAEINLLGVGMAGRGTLRRRMQSFVKAAEWEDTHLPNRNSRADASSGAALEMFEVSCGDSATSGLPSESFDLVLTDPPYHDDVQYSELAGIFTSWITGVGGYDRDGDATVSRLASNPEEHSYGDLLLPVFSECLRVTCADGRLVFSYANHNFDAWAGLFDALTRSGWHPIALVSVHGENETDFVKRGVNSAIDDFILELGKVPPADGRLPLVRVRGAFALCLGRWFSRIGSSSVDWHQQFKRELLETTKAAK